MRYQFRCDCGGEAIEETIAKAELDRWIECDDCGQQFILTLTRL